MNEHQHDQDDMIDADVSGHLAMALFGGVIVLILITIYALAMAA